MRRVIGVIALVAAPAAALAETSDDAIKQATALFESGVKKMEAGRCEDNPIGDTKLCTEARDDFRNAYARYPDGLGALRNLAFVEKGLGLVAAASRHFRELADKAPLDPKPARRVWAEFARTELALLAPRVPHLTISLPKPVPDGASVTLDDVALDSSQAWVPIPVEPGAHIVRVVSPGYLPFTRAVALAEGESASVDVTLTPVVKPSAPPPPAPLVDKPTSHLPQAMVIGAGAATLVVGLGFGAAAIYKRGDACDGAVCDRDEYERGRGYARASTILTIGGSVAVASGIVWWVLTPDRAHTALAPYASSEGAGVRLFHSF